MRSAHFVAPREKGARGEALGPRAVRELLVRLGENGVHDTVQRTLVGGLIRHQDLVGSYALQPPPLPWSHLLPLFVEGPAVQRTRSRISSVRTSCGRRARDPRIDRSRTGDSGNTVSLSRRSICRRRSAAPARTPKNCEHS